MAKAVWFGHDKNGKRVAYYWSTQAQRAIRMPVTEAELLIAQGKARNIHHHPVHGPKRR